MTAPIDTAYVEIVARDKSLEKLEKDVDKAFKKIDKNAAADLKKIDKNFDDALDAIDGYFADLSRNADVHLDSVAKSSDDMFTEINADVTRSERNMRASFKRMSDSADGAFGDIDANFGRPLTRRLGQLGELIGDFGRTLGQIGSAIGGAVASSPLLLLILALVPAIIALAAALSSLIGLVGLLPAGLGFLLAAILPLVIAFQNFGDAVSAIASGDVDKANEALKKLSASAGFVAREVGAALPALRSFQRVMQEAFFSQLRGAFTQLINVLLPGIRTGISSVLISLGQLTRQFINLAAAPDSVGTLNELFTVTARIITRLTPTFIRFADTIIAMVHEAIFIVERLAGTFGNALDQFLNFVNQAIESGDFEKFIEDAITTFKELLGLVRAIGGLIGTLFAGTEEAGHSFIQTLTDIITRLDTFLKTAEGQDAIDTLVIAVAALGAAIGFVIDSFILAQKIFSEVSLFLFELGEAFGELVQDIGEFLGKIPAAIEEFIGGIPNAIETLFTQAFDRALLAVGIGIGTILFAIQVLPGMIIEFLTSLPDRVYAIFLRFSQIILGFITQTVDEGQSSLTSGFDAMIEFIKSVPNRIIALGPVFLNAGKNLITSFMNGFRAVGGFIGDVAGDIVASVKGFLNRAIDRINSGIATIDAVLPGDLGRIPRLANGAFVPRRPGGILANIGEGNDDEWVLPDRKLQEIINNDNGSAITFGPGAIQINFSGVVPTEAEARTVGETIGESIISRVARQNIRAQVRAI